MSQFIQVFPICVGVGQDMDVFACATALGLIEDSNTTVQST